MYSYSVFTSRGMTTCNSSYLSQCRSALVTGNCRQMSFIICVVNITGPDTQTHTDIHFRWGSEILHKKIGGSHIMRKISNPQFLCKIPNPNFVQNLRPLILL